MAYVDNITIWSGTFVILMLDTGIKLRITEAEFDCSTSWKFFFFSFYNVFFKRLDLRDQKKKRQNTKSRTLTGLEFSKYVPSCTSTDH